MVFVILDNPTNKDSVLDIRVPIFRPGKPPEIKSYMEQFPFPFYIILRDINALPLTLSDALRQWFELVSCLEWSYTKRLLHDSWCTGDCERKRGAFCDIVEVPVARFISSPYGYTMEFIWIWFLWQTFLSLCGRRLSPSTLVLSQVSGLENAIQPHEMLDIVITKNFMIHSDRRITSWHSDGPFRVAPRLCFKARLSAKLLLWKGFVILMKRELILQEGFCTKPLFESESFCNSEMA